MTRDDDSIPVVPDGPRRPARGGAKQARRAFASKPHPCPNCGYDLRGQRLGARCPECGALSLDPAHHHGPALLMHCGRPAVISALFVLVPFAILVLLSLACVLLGTLGAWFDDRLVFAIPAAALPLCAAGLVLVSPRLTRPADLEDGTDRRARVAAAITALLWFVHAAIVTKAFIELRKPTPLTGSMDVILTTAVTLAIIAAIAYFVSAATRLRGFEYWLTGDNEGSLFMGTSGLLVYGPLLVVAFLNAVWALLTPPIVRAAWRLDRAIVFLATLDVAWRSLRALRLAMHSLRHATELTERAERIEEDREERFGAIVRNQQR